MSAGGSGFQTIGETYRPTGGVTVGIDIREVVGGDSKGLVSQGVVDFQSGNGRLLRRRSHPDVRVIFSLVLGTLMWKIAPRTGQAAAGSRLWARDPDGRNAEYPPVRYRLNSLNALHDEPAGQSPSQETENHRRLTPCKTARNDAILADEGIAEIWKLRLLHRHKYARYR